jgi:hypothetical protein
LFGLNPWRRLPARSARGRQSSAEIADLKQHILERLLAFPDLAVEFSEAIAAECADGRADLDLRIGEVWRCAGSASGLTSGALQELLADSDHAADYRAAAARELHAGADAQTARAELAGAFTKLELRRVNAELEALAAGLQPDAEVLARIRTLSELRARLMASERSDGGQR